MQPLSHTSWAVNRHLEPLPSMGLLFTHSWMHQWESVCGLLCNVADDKPDTPNMAGNAG